jgi:hypothetical protein
LQNLCVDERVIFKYVLKKWDAEAWTGLLWLKKGTGVGLLWIL